MTWEQWYNTARGSVRTTDDKHREIANLAYYEDRNGGKAGTWHMSSIVHDNARCVCVECNHGFNG